jgi:hypothetical protein
LNDKLKIQIALDSNEKGMYALGKVAMVYMHNNFKVGNFSDRNVVEQICIQRNCLSEFKIQITFLEYSCKIEINMSYMDYQVGFMIEELNNTVAVIEELTIFGLNEKLNVTNYVSSDN